MKHHIIEIKAKCLDASSIRQILLDKKADFKGKDHQIDTYFNTSNGRLKLRQGTIESALIQYNRPNQEGPKRSDVLLYKSPDSESLKALLTASIGVKVVVDKKREIYFIDNVKFHIDVVKDLGHFVEIEAIAPNADTSEKELLEQCQHYLTLFSIPKEDLIAVSYSDLLLEKQA